ncbi:hypothetical protein RvY_10509 [Ramazzottius varieornatus]|uniref:Reverse transcriptase domain-containing protein n=1 Tax=Ramazzottius varieornatus TaxID=947166 RepID=A0A1D1VIC1_RAMVA|nr:hypothetical protein RvY_10509 [Ramazzottius varieornatus]
MYSGLTARVEVGGEVTEAVPVRRGVLQGDPLSPLLFNLSINFLLDQLNGFELKNALGVNVNNVLAVSAFAFADDLVIVGKNRAALALLVRIAIDGLDSIGLVVNAKQSTVMDVIYESGERVVDGRELDIGGSVTMPALTKEETVVYLGVKYRFSLGFDLKQELEEFGAKLQKLFAFNCLRLPSNAPTGFLFASRASGGLAMPKPTEEYVIQQINSAVLLNNSTDEYVKEFRKPSQEIDRIVANLDIKVEVTERDMVEP